MKLPEYCFTDYYAYSVSQVDKLSPNPPALIKLLVDITNGKSSTLIFALLARHHPKLYYAKFGICLCQTGYITQQIFAKHSSVSLSSNLRMLKPSLLSSILLALAAVEAKVVPVVLDIVNANLAPDGFVRSEYFLLLS